MNKTRIPGFALVSSALGPPGPGPPPLLLLVVDSVGDVISVQPNEHTSVVEVPVFSLTYTLLLSKHTEVFLLLTPAQSCAAAGHSWVLETTVILSAQTQINLIFRHVPFCFQQQSVIRRLFTFHHTNTRIIILSIIQRETKLGSVFPCRPISYCFKQQISICPQTKRTYTARRLSQNVNANFCET